MYKKINLFIVDDELDFRKLFIKAMPEDKYNVHTFASGEEVLMSNELEDYDVGLIDVSMPGISGIDLLTQLKDKAIKAELIMLTGNASIETAIEAIKLGAYDYLSKPFRLSEMELVIQRAFEKKELIQRNLAYKDEISQMRGSSDMIGESSKIMEVQNLICKVADSDVPVLIQGESGTGKELAAKAVHENSNRKEKPYIVIDCSSLQDTLLENELFGHEKGSFTDAIKDKKGLFEIADKGTLFLDEIGEMSKNIQSKLLRVLETKKFRRIGGTKEISVDVRIIAATNRDLEAEVTEGNFRKDLFYRLNVIALNMPSLRERSDDIPLLVDYYLSNNMVSKKKKKVSKAALKLLEEYHWPGNVRELINVMSRSMILSEGNVIEPADLRILLEKEMLSYQKADININEKEDLNGVIDEAERDCIVRILKQNRNSKTKTAKLLKISRATLYRKLRKYNLLDNSDE
jgi:DNA-binding NtrC family response regulator